MAALSSARMKGEPRSTGFLTLPVKGATTIYGGALVCLDATGYAVPGAVATTLTAMGIAEETVVNAGADGAKTVVVRTSAGELDHLLENDGTNAVAITHVGKDVYVQDDQTVCSLATGRSVAGKCTGVTSKGVYVRFPL